MSSSEVRNLRSLPVRRANAAKKKPATSPFSVADPSFCPLCGCILPLPGLTDVITCKLCCFKQNTEGARAEANRMRMN